MTPARTRKRRDPVKSLRRVLLVMLLGFGAATAEAAPTAAVQVAAVQVADNAGARTLGLDEVLSRARAENRDLKVARARLEQASAAVGQAWTALYPVAGVQARYTHNHTGVAIDPSRFGGGNPMGMAMAASKPIVIQEQEQLDGVANVTVPLLVPWAYPAVRAARANERAAVANFAVSETNILLSAAQTFYQAAGADEVLRARQSAVEVARRGLNDANTRFAAGNVTKVDVARAELAVVRAEQTVRDAEYARSQAYRGLATLIQLPEAFRVVPGEAASPPTPSMDFDTVLKLRPEFAAAAASEQAFAAQARANGWRWAPTLSGFASGRVSNYGGFAGDKYVWSVGVVLDWTLFDGGLRDVQRRVARAQQHEAVERALALRDSVRDDLANAGLLLKTKQAARGSAEKSVELARATLELVRIQYESGATTQLYLLEAQDNLVLAEVGMAQARFELALAELGLQRTAGTFPAPQ
jgi:outer membrane protein TolC